MNCELMLTYDTPTLWQTGSRNLTGPKTLPTIWHTYMKLVTKYQIPVINSCWEKCAYMFNVYKNQQNRQTGSRNLMGPKTLPTIWGNYMKLVTKYQISAINSCWEKCDEKWAYMFNVYKNQQSRQTGSRNLTGPKTLTTIWYTYMMLVTKYQISAINCYWEKCEGGGGIKNSCVALLQTSAFKFSISIVVTYQLNTVLLSKERKFSIL
jgi:ribosome biogenesis protein Tsr3